LEFLSQNEILVHVYSHYGYYMGTFYPREHNNSGFLILQQATHYLDYGKRLDLARRFVQGAMQNLVHVIRYYERRGKDLETIRTAVEGHLVRISEQKTVEQLMQVEGQAREAYYQAFDRILEDPDFAFEERTRRPPQNRLNALLSFGNSLLYTRVLSEIYRTHLDPRIGFLHATNFRRFALNLDVAEVFKPLLVDRTILSLIQKGQIQAKHFDETLGGLYLKEEGRKRFLEACEERFGTTIQHRGLGRHVSYRTLIRLELYKLEKHFMGEREYRPFRTRW
jgi:CRISPR-associated protein Cas1